jgi:transposase
MSYSYVIDGEDKKLVDKRISNDLNAIIALLSPNKKELNTVAVESTFNGYWLVDGLI